MDPVETKAPIDSEVLEENKSSSTESTVATDDDHVPVENNSSSSVSTTYNSRQSIDEKYTIALDEGRFTAYQQIVTGKGSAATVAFFAITLKSEGSIACANETQSAHFQHGDILKDHIFMIAVSKETTNSDVHLVFVRKEWFFNLYDRLISEKKTISSSATLFEKGELDNPGDYLEVFSRSEVLKKEEAEKTLQLNGTLTIKGQRMLLLHLMKATLDDSSFLANNMSSMNGEDSNDRGCPSSHHQEELDQSMSAGEIHNNEADSNFDGAVNEEIAAPIPKLRHHSFQSRSIDAIKTHSRYGIIGGENISDHLPAKRCRRSVLKNEVSDDETATKANSVVARAKGTAKAKSTVATKPAAAAAIITAKSKSVLKAKSTTAAATSTKAAKQQATVVAVKSKRINNSRTRNTEVEVKIEKEEEDVDEETVSHSTTTRGGRKRKTPAQKECPSFAVGIISDQNSQTMAQQRVHAKQIAEMQSENEKLKTLMLSQSKMISEVITKITVEQEEKAKGTNNNQRAVQSEIILPPSTISNPSHSSHLVETASGVGGTSLQSANNHHQLQLLQSTTQLQSMMQLQQNTAPTNNYPFPDGISNIPMIWNPNCSGSSFQQHQYMPQQYQQLQQQQQQQLNYLQQQHFQSVEQQQQAAARRRQNSNQAALAGFLALLATTQQRDD